MGDQAPSKDSDGNWKVLLAEKDKMFVYYLPANTEGHLSYFTHSKALSDQTLLKENMFCSVTISDPDKLTDLKDYYYVRAGEDYSVTLPTKDGYKWKCLDRKTMKEIEPTTTTTSEDGNKVTYTFKNLQYGIKIEPVNPKNNKIKIVYDAATVENNLEKLNQVTAGIQKPDYEGQVQGEGTFTTTISRNEQSYKLLNVDSKRVRVSVPSSSKNKKYWYKFNGWTLGDTALKYNAGDTLSVKELKSYEVNGEITLKATWTGLNTNGRIASCNFYVNRYCEIADNLSNGFSAAPEQDFTKSLYTAGVDEDNNLSLDKNGDLGILAPATEESGAYETDTALRSMVKTPYQGITFESFPSDEQVLENIRSNSNPIKVGDRVVTKDQLTTDNFKVRWYSFKFVHSDGWHVDGILVAKEGKLVVTKTFTGSAKKAISELKDKFSIDVTHKDKPTANDPDTEDYKLVIKPKSDAGSGETGYDSYNEKTNTYTWVLKARDYQTYNLKEKNYELEDFNNSSYTYTVRNNEANTDLESDGKDVSRQDLEWQKYSDDGVEVTAKAYPDDVPSTAYQTVSFRNMYVKAHYITIDKIDDFTINGMENVKFQISSLDEPDTFEVWKNPKANAYNYEEDDSEYGFTQRVEDNTLETDETGLIHIKLKPGAYILKEKNVEGYKAQPQFRIQVDEDGHIAESYPCDDAGNKVTNSDSDVVTSPSSSVISISNKAEELTSVTAKANMHDVKANSVQVELWCNGSKMSGSQYTQTLSKDDNWTYTWKNLPLYADGKVANYTLRETKIGDVSYDPGTNTDGFGDYIVTYDKCKYREADSGEYNDPASWTDDNGKHHYAKHALLVVHNENEKPEELVLSVNAKILWNDKNNQDGIRPDYMDLKIEDADGEQSGNSLELNSDNSWSAKFAELNKYKDNHEVSYAITDKCFTAPEGYTAEITGDMVNGFIITLTHKPETTTIEGTKAWSDSGKKNLRPDSVTVSLLADGEKVDETTTTADKNWKFSFDNKPVYKDGKKITYTVKESDVANYTPTYSTDDEGNFVITNKYVPTSVKLTGDTALRMTTVVTGKASTEAFVSELTAAEDYGDAVKMPEDNTVTTADKIAKGGSEENTFSPVEITQEGTYTFRVKTTTQAKKPGWIYDNNSKTLTVKVVDQNGKLVVDQAASTLNAVATHSFHAAALEGDTAITIQKKLTGRSMWGDEKFSFTLSAADDATKKAVDDGDVELAETKASVSKMQNGATATVSFGRAEFKEEGTYTFQAKEEKGNLPGMTYDTEAKTIKVKVQGENGVLKATQESVPTFENVYRAEGSFTPEGTKTLLSANGNKLSVGENQFKFSVRILGDDTNKVVATGTTGSGKDAKINFTTMTYSLEDLEKLAKKDYVLKIVNDNYTDYTLVYVVTEEPTGKDSLQQNTQSQQFDVTYRDTCDGKLTVMGLSGKKIAFENRYVTDTATVSMEGSKVLEGRDLAKDEFSFHITSDDANAPMPKETTVKNDASGNVSFGDITYTKDDLGDATSKTYTYKITESGSQAGVTNDSETKTVKVTVKDDGEGHLTAETEPGAAPLFTFTNKYSAAPTESAVTDSVKVKKVLEGGSLTADQFHFVMKDEGGDVVAKASNKADGSINFPALKFTKAGTYNYTISEEAGDSSQITYDNTVYNVTASVTDDFQGKLHVEWNCGVKSISFHNVYTATPVSVEPKVVKTITGDTPEAKETFRFALSGVSAETAGSAADGSEGSGSSNSNESAMPPMPEGSEDGTKTIAVEGEGTGYFGPITFEKAGTYRYQVIEETGSNADYTYDTTAYELTYVVTDKDGELQVKESIQAQPENKAAEIMTFTNKYQKPADPTPNPDPGKGDNGNHGNNGNNGNNGSGQNGGHANGSNGGGTNGNHGSGNSGSGSHLSSHTPQTGDDGNTGFFLGLMGISAAMLAGVTGLRKKFALKK